MARNNKKIVVGGFLPPPKAPKSVATSVGYPYIPNDPIVPEKIKLRFLPLWILWFCLSTTYVLFYLAVRLGG